MPCALHNLMHNKVLHERIVLVSVQVHDALRAEDRPRRGARLKGISTASSSATASWTTRTFPPRCLVRDAGLTMEVLETSFFPSVARR